MRTIVIGAGILGASTAYHLSKFGIETWIVDRRHVGQATDAAAGIVCPWLSQRRNKAWYELAKRGARYYPSLIRDLEREGQRETGYARVGALSVRKQWTQLTKIEERARLRKESAPEMGELSLLTPEQTRELFPVLDPSYASLRVTGAARVDGRALRDALLAAAKNRGATLVEGEATLLRDGTRIVGVKTNGQSIEAKQTIVCAGAWARSLLAPLGVDLKVGFQKGQIVHLRLPDAETNRWPVIMPQGNHYLLSFEDHRVVVGTTHEDTDEYDPRPTAGGINDILTKALDAAPGLSRAEYIETRVGFRPYTPTFLPVFGRLPGWDGLIVGNGLGASGLTVGPYVGYELARLAAGLETDLNLGLYDVKEALD